METSEQGFSLAETMIALVLMLIVSTTVATGLLRMTEAQATIWNRTEMHSSVRGATELLQQEVGQAGLISLPATVTLQTAVTTAGSQAVTLSSVTGMFVGERLTFDAGTSEETAAVTAIDTANAQVTAVFVSFHAVNSPVRALGGFSAGIVPTTTTNGSTGSVLKLFGDINGDGSMVYIEYTCDAVAGNLYRNVMPFDAATKTAISASQVLLSNVQPNPDDAACFTYQQAVVLDTTFVTDVAITLTVQTQQKDAVTKQYQKETKALLNVSPRNVFNAWNLASISTGSIGTIDRIQPTPPSVTNLLQ